MTDPVWPLIQASDRAKDIEGLCYGLELAIMGTESLEESETNALGMLARAAIAAIKALEADLSEHIDKAKAEREGKP